MPKIDHTTPRVAFSTPEQEDNFMISISDCRSISKACRAWGLDKGAMYWHAVNHPPFLAKLDKAKEALYMALTDDVPESWEELLSSKDDDKVNKRANAVRSKNEQTMRMLGILNRRYGEKPTNVTNIQNNTAVIVDEQARQRIQDLRKEILLPSKDVEAKLLDQPCDSNESLYTEKQTTTKEES